MKRKTGKTTIGLMVSGIMDDYTESICKGVNRAAKEENVDVVIFPGKYLDRDLSDDRELMYEYQHSTVFSYIKNSGIDALVVAADCIGCFTSKKRIIQLLEEYEGIPVVLIASKLEGYTGVTFDNYQGIKDGLEYLIGNGCRKFAMIGASDENVDACERKQAFISVLAGHGITFEDSMFAEGDLTGRQEKVFEQLLDRNPGVEAIFCVNDDTALGLYKVLKRRGLHIGQDIAVFAYDDTVAAAQASPSLASVRADAVWLGEEAVRMAQDRIRGGHPESKVMPTRLIMRKSISGESAGINKERFYRPKDFDVHFAEIFHRNVIEEMTEQLMAIRMAYKKLVIAFTRNALNGFRSPEGNSEIMLCADEFINVGGMRYADVDILLSHFEMAYNLIRGTEEDHADKTMLRDIFFVLYRRAVHAMSVVVGDMEQEKINESFDMKVFVQDILQFEKGKDQSYGVLLEKLGWLSIRNAELYMLEKPVLHLFKEKFPTPETLWQKAVLKDGVVKTVPVMRQQRKLETVYLRRENEPYSCRIVLPLFSNETVYGMLLCDMTDEIHDNGEFLINQMSAAVKMLKLLETNENIQRQLEDNLAMLRDSNIKLDTLSKSDVLTGIYNRRGFYDEAEKLIKKYHEKGQNVLTVYVDMNNLKIINDRYGHEEGDHSLKLIGSILHDVAGKDGVAGRIGGDEYAFAIPYTGDKEGAEVLEDLYGRFEDYNAVSDKKYNITVSAGACVMGWQSELLLKDALLQADERLYLVKQKRKKDVAKHR